MATSSSTYLLQTASIDWGDDNVPRSSQYGDVYYCREQGLAETRYVFLEQNELALRFSELGDNSLFTIAETGFGTGLNFLAAWQLWRESAGLKANCRLHFASVEKHPLRKSDLQHALAQWPELNEFSTLLLNGYPELLAGHHRVEFDEGRVILDLVFADAEQGLSSLRSSIHPLQMDASARVDAWFLDGFAPSSNPEMWSDVLFEHIAALSKPGCSFSTFTAVGYVKRGLRERGFTVDKVAGFGHKRDMLRGYYQRQAERGASENTDPNNSEADKLKATPKRKRSVENAWHLPLSQPRPRSVVIVGAGLAGCHTAAALAKRGLQVSIIEKNSCVASAASGNPQAILYTKLSHQAGLLNQYALTSFLYACRVYRAMHDLPGDLCGVLQLQGVGQKEQFDKLRKAFANQESWCQFVDPIQTSKLAGIEINSHAVYFPNAGWLRPRELCERLLAHSNIRLISNYALSELHHDQGWHLRDDKGHELFADAVVLANSHESIQLPQLAHLPLRINRGQLSILKNSDFVSTPNAVICHEGYIAPPVDGQMVIGASYDPKDYGTDVRSQDNDSNLEKLRAAIRSIQIQPKSINARVALRCTSPDYLPLVGPVPIVEQQREIFAPLAKDAKILIKQSAAYYPGLYVNVAHGSRGLTSTPMAAELLASQIGGELLPLPRDLMRALSPSRFLIRELIRSP